MLLNKFVLIFFSINYLNASTSAIACCKYITSANCIVNRNCCYNSIAEYGFNIFSFDSTLIDSVTIKVWCRNIDLYIPKFSFIVRIKDLNSCFCCKWCNFHKM